MGWIFYKQILSLKIVFDPLNIIIFFVFNKPINKTLNFIKLKRKFKVNRINKSKKKDDVK